jgi:hypothetical protein
MSPIIFGRLFLPALKTHLQIGSLLPQIQKLFTAKAQRIREGREENQNRIKSPRRAEACDTREMERLYSMRDEIYNPAWFSNFGSVLHLGILAFWHFFLRTAGPLPVFPRG